MKVQRIYVKKKNGFDQKAKKLLKEIRSYLKIESVTDLKVFNRYDVEGLEKELFELCIPTVFSDVRVDDVFTVLPSDNSYSFAVEALPGQFDQKAASCAECIQIAHNVPLPTVRTAMVIALYGQASTEEISRIKAYIINPIECREANPDLPETLDPGYQDPAPIEVLNGFIDLDEAGLLNLTKKYSLSLDLDDIKHCQEYFKSEKRNPTITEIKVLATYWSDHCRHTTFLTAIDDVKINDSAVNKSYEKYLSLRSELYQTKQKDITLMDLATIGARYLKSKGLLNDLDESEEVNACSVKIDVNVEGKAEKWILMFKNETHNHPTEMEPLGGAATCVGGAIRDPLSGRAYVYQAMRVTGSGDPTVPVSDTLPGKLPQRTITTKAAEGYSHYGNQIGVTAGLVQEIYHPGYIAKRMELGAVVAAAPAENVIRKVPKPSDVVILLGAKTGRDGCGGATGSSKGHTTSSLELSGAEVQKGDAPEERKILRLFRNPEAARLIIRCNDFGAGGVSVAIGELADGLLINLNAVPVKYPGLSGTELAISESQERMAIVLEKENVDKFISLAASENLTATPIAVVTEEKRLKIEWNGSTIVDISRDFLNTNGIKKHTSIVVNQNALAAKVHNAATGAKAFRDMAGDLKTASQRGLVQRFDATGGAGTVLMPFGGKHQKTPVQVMACKIPVLFNDTTTCSVMAYGFDPYLSEQNPYIGAYYAVVSSVAKLVAAGCSHEKIWLSFQEYFESISNVPEKWGKPFAALLGALEAQLALNAAAIGGKDSMSGTFEDIDVPPTLVSFAITTQETSDIISPEFKAAGSRVVYLIPEKTPEGLLDPDSLNGTFRTVRELIKSGAVVSAYALDQGGICEALFKMALGNGIGFKLCNDSIDLTAKDYGSFVLELSETAEMPENAVLLAHTTDEYSINTGTETVSIKELEDVYYSKLEDVFPSTTAVKASEAPKIEYKNRANIVTRNKFARPKVFIPAFPGTNGEYDMGSAFLKAGAEVDIRVLSNKSLEDIEASRKLFADAIKDAQIIAFSGGSSGGDEPDGSGKLIDVFFRTPALIEAVHDLLDNRDGLILGICNGFQALLKLGLLPHGKISDVTEQSPTLAMNEIARTQSAIVRTKVASVKSPWLMLHELGDVHSVAVAHSEGRFYADDSVIKELIANGQIAEQYVNLAGEPSMDIAFNPSGSTCAIESITSPDGRVLGKMGHTERYSNGIYKNIHGSFDQLIFEGAVKYFK